MSLREFIDSTAKPNMIAVEVPSWGRTVHIKELSVTENLAMLKAIGDEFKEGEAYIWALVYTLCDADGNNLYKPDEYGALASAKPAHVLVKLGNVALKLNHLIGDAIDEAKKNSGQNQNSPSCTESATSTDTPPVKCVHLAEVIS
jgi:hypothetical protein